MLITRFGTIASQIVGGGGIDEYTKTMLHFNGTDASTTFTDVIGRTWTAYGNAQLDTAQKVFGTASLLLDGTGDYIDTPDSEDFNVGSGNFTISWRNKLNSTGSFYRVCGQSTSSGVLTEISMRIQIGNTGTLTFSVASGGTFYTATSTGTLDTNWHHIECCRDGNTLRIFIDGNADGTADVTGITVNNSAGKFAIGRLGELDIYYFNGWIDEFKFDKGIARHTSNFTPPTSEYTV